MPLPPSTYMSLVLPTPGGDSGTWDEYLNTAIGGLLDAHRHIPGEGRQVPTAGIDVDADFSLNGFRLDSAAGVELTNLASVLATGARELFVSSGNLYYRNNSGQNVRITLGSTIDFTGFGGIGGDYSTVGALVAYVDASDKYTFQQEEVLGVRHYAKNEAADLIIHPFHAAGSPGDVLPAVTLKAPAALAASYSLTHPAGLPGTGETLIQQVDDAGLITWSNTVGALTTGNLTVNDDITTVGQVDVGGALIVADPATFNNEIYHSYIFSLLLPASCGEVDTVPSVAAQTWRYSGGAPAAWRAGASMLANSLLSFPIILKQVDRIREVHVEVRDTSGGGGANTISAKLFVSDPASGTGSQLGSTETSNGSGDPQTLTLGPYSIPLTSQSFYHVLVSNNTTTVSNHAVYGISIDYDRIVET